MNLRKNPFFISLIILIISLYSLDETFSQTDSVYIKSDSLLSAVDSTYIAVDSLLVNDSSFIKNDSIAVSDSAVKGIKPPPPIPEEVPLLSKADSLKVGYFMATIDSLKSGDLHSIDTSILRFHQYDPLRFGNLFYSTLSNIGLAHKNFIYTPTLASGYRVNSFLKFSTPTYLFPAGPVPTWKRSLLFFSMTIS